MTRRFAHLLLAGLVILSCSCKKTKFNTILNPTGNEVAASSSIRLFNFYNYNLDITVNGIPLTTYGKAASNGTEFGLTLFPSGSWQNTANGNPFFVPSTLVTKDRKVHVQIQSVPGSIVAGIAFTIASIDTVLTDDPLNPKDYYALATGRLLVVPRNSQAPVQPDHFKIRIINLGQTSDPNNVTGPMTVTYSDGTTVDPLLANINTDSISAYVDLPYGAYMFKVFSNLNGNDYSHQVAELPLLPDLNVCTVPTPVSQQALFPQLRTFKPGATYSIVLTPNVETFQPCSYAVPPTIAVVNGYRIITEQNPGPNVTYARMDAFNALPVLPLTVKVDGQPMSAQLPYAAYTDYSIYVQGTHKVEAVDENGNVLVTKSITLAPYDNYTAWVYETPAGKADICFANTDMTSSIYLTDPGGNVFTENGSYPTLNVPPVDDGTNGTLRVATTPYAWQTRFLNLAPDLPYATFTDNGVTFPVAGNGTLNNGGTSEYGDSSNFPAASINLAPGSAPNYDPFVIFQYQVGFGVLGDPSNGFASLPVNFPPSVIRVFASTPGPPALIPGDLLGNIAPLTSDQYITNKAMYTGAYMPQSEPGVYTTALIGRVHNPGSSQAAARLVILKHNK